jgi:hypothetical protein
MKPIIVNMFCLICPSFERTNPELINPVRNNMKESDN